MTGVYSRRRVTGILRRSSRSGVHRLLKRLSEASNRAGVWLEVPCVSFRASREWIRAALSLSDEMRASGVEVNLVFICTLGLIVDWLASLRAKKRRTGSVRETRFKLWLQGWRVVWRR